MKNTFGATPEDLLNSPQAAKLAAKKDDIERIAGSKDGQQVKAMLEKDGGTLQDAFARGDMATLQAAVSDILKTDAGTRLAKQLSEMLGQE